jgi:hypothetical protein
MISITKLVVRSFTLDYLDIFWEISPLAGPTVEGQPHEIFDYDFYVLRAEAPAGPYQQIGGPFRDTYSFRDLRINLLHKWRSLHYKIKIVHRPTGETTESNPASSNDPEPDLIAEEINRLEDILFREFIGRKCWLFPVRTFGPLCTCVDPVLKRRARSNHALCFGTGWLGGYHNPVECYVQFDPSAKQTMPNSLQEQQPSNTSARLISFPPVSPRDILVESENRRWRVVSVTTTQRLRSSLHQELTLHEIPRGDIEYELPVKVDVKGLVPSAERNFTNPHNVERDGDYQDIFAFFGHARGTQR